ncbi:MAG: hypothetical protein EBZ77_10155 [Chitinophagia bacterium]|nr:hypothetical protein [Chitinophagia bacterium]
MGKFLGFIAICCLLGSLAHGQLPCASLQPPADSLKQQKPAQVPQLPPVNLQKLPPALYTQNFGFFCRQELRWEHKGLPLKLRVGQPGDCERMEQKVPLTAAGH